MRIFFAVSNSSTYLNLLKEEKVDNVLISFAFFKSAYKTREIFGDYQPKNLILDSGAFSVWSKGDEIDIDQYAVFCQDIIKLFSETNCYCVNLDVIPGKFGKRPTSQEIIDSAEQGWKNMEYLESKGLKVIPVFHQHEDFSVLDKLTKHTDYIGVSPANDCSMEEKLSWQDQVYSILVKQPELIKTHGFAVTSTKQLYRYPLFSADSSSWTSPSRFGTIPIVTDDLEMKVIKYKDKTSVMKYWEYIKDWSIEKLSSEDWKDRITLSIKSYLLLNKIANKLWDKRGIKWK